MSVPFKPTQERYQTLNSALHAIFDPITTPDAFGVFCRFLGVGVGALRLSLKICKRPGNRTYFPYKPPGLVMLLVGLLPDFLQAHKVGCA